MQSPEFTTDDLRHDRQGRDADRPSAIPAPGWKNVLKGVGQRAKDDSVTLVAAGVAFYAMLALAPALAAMVSVYGLFADPADVQRHVAGLTGAAPDEVGQLLAEQLGRISSQADSALGFGLVLGLVLALWSAANGVRALMTGVEITYEEDEERGFLRIQGLALLLTIGAIVLASLVLGFVAVVPPLMDGLATWIRVPIQIVGWAVLAVFVVLAIGVLYRLAPSREDARIRWLSPGAVVATLLWLVASGGFSLYLGWFGRYNETYGSLGAIVVVLLWLWISALAVLVGALLNAELEHQTRRDTTTGPEEPLGSRDAEVADKVASVRS